MKRSTAGRIALGVVLSPVWIPIGILIGSCMLILVLAALPGTIVGAALEYVFTGKWDW